MASLSTSRRLTPTSSKAVGRPPTNATRVLHVLYAGADLADQAAFQRLIRRERLPYTCSVAASVSEARGMMNERPLDLIVAEFSLPDGAGMEIARRAKDIPCIILRDGDDEEAPLTLADGSIVTQVTRWPDRSHLRILAFAIDAAVRLARAERKIRLLSRAVQNTADAVYVCDIFGRIIFVNAAFTSIYGYSTDEILGQQAPILEGDEAAAHEHGDVPVDIRPARAAEVAHVHRDGRRLDIRSTRSAMSGPDRHAENAVFVVQDLTARKTLEADLRRSKLTCASLEALATTDALTGLDNRRELGNKLTAELKRSERSNLPLSVIMLDADHFKSVNDTHGHQAGDDVLRALATLLKGTLRSIDMVARYGGEELTILLPDTSADGASIVANRIRAEIEQTPFVVRSAAQGSVGLNVTVSVGVATQDGPPMTADDLLRLADEAMYAAKRAGRNRVEIFGRP